MARQRNNRNETPAEEDRSPAHVVRDGALAFKVWQNQSDDGQPYYKVTLDKLYSDPNTGETKRTQSFDQADLLKIQNMAPEAYRAISLARQQDREMNQGQTPQQDMRRSRDQAMNGAASTNEPGQGSHQQRRGPDHF